MDKMKCASLLVVIFTLFQPVICFSSESNQKYPKVRLQDNGWIKILEQHEEEKFVERYGYKVWYLHVKILFLKYCKASLKKSRTDSIAEAVQDLDTSIIYRFRCNYRTTVCLTLYSSDGAEYSTIKEMPVATKDRMEIFPGETIWVTFLQPLISPFKKPVSWQIWVPK